MHQCSKVEVLGLKARLTPEQAALCVVTAADLLRFRRPDVAGDPTIRSGGPRHVFMAQKIPAMCAIAEEDLAKPDGLADFKALLGPVLRLAHACLRPKFGPQAVVRADVGITTDFFSRMFLSVSHTGMQNHNYVRQSLVEPDTSGGQTMKDEGWNTVCLCWVAGGVACESLRSDRRDHGVETTMQKTIRAFFAGEEGGILDALVMLAPDDGGHVGDQEELFCGKPRAILDSADMERHLASVEQGLDGIPAMEGAGAKRRANGSVPHAVATNLARPQLLAHQQLQNHFHRLLDGTFAHRGAATPALPVLSGAVGMAYITFSVRTEDIRRLGLDGDWT